MLLQQQQAALPQPEALAKILGIHFIAADVQRRQIERFGIETEDK